MKAGSKLGLAGVVVALAGTTVGCASNTTSSTTSGSNQKVTINWYTESMNPGTTQAMAAAFEKAYPNIHVNVQTGPSSTDALRTSISTTVSSGSATPDVYLGDVTWPGEFAKNSIAMDLSKTMPKTFWKRYSSDLLTEVQYKGEYYGAPFDTSPTFLYYRKDLLAKAHLPVPKTWAELEQDSKLLTQQHLVKYGYVWQGNSYEGLTCDWVEVLADFGGSVYNQSNTKVTINSPQAVQALSTMRGLITSGVSPSAVSTFEEPQALNTFTAGDAAFMRNWGYAWGVSADPKSSKVDGKVGVAPLPAVTAAQYPGYSNIGGSVLYINPHTQHLDQDITFINWLTDVQAQKKFATFGYIPTNYAAQGSKEVLSLSPINAVAHQVRVVGRPTFTTNYPSVSQSIYTQINAALSGSVTPQKALANIASALNQSSSSNGGL